MRCKLIYRHNVTKKISHNFTSFVNSENLQTCSIPPSLHPQSLSLTYTDDMQTLLCDRPPLKFQEWNVTNHHRICICTELYCEAKPLILTTLSLPKERYSWLLLVNKTGMSFERVSLWDLTLHNCPVHTGQSCLLHYTQ